MSDNTKQTEIIIGLVNKFDYNDRAVKSRLNGHPLEGRVYRILKDKIPFSNDFVYSLHIGNREETGLDCIMLGDHLQGDYANRWAFDITELNQENYIKYDIQEEDLKKILTWFETDNEDLKKFIVTEKHAAAQEDDEISSINLSTLAAAYESPDEKEFHKTMIRLMDSINVIMNSGKSRAKAICEVLQDLSEYHNSFTEEYIIHAESNEAFSSAILTALYSKTYNEKEICRMLIRYGLAELQRLNKNSKNEEA